MGDQELYYLLQALVNMIGRIDPNFLPKEMQWTLEEEQAYEKAKLWVENH